MSLEVTPDFGTQDAPDLGGGARLSVALIGPDERRRRLLATAITESKLANVREFRSYPTGVEDLKWLLSQSYDVVILDLDNDQNVALDLVQRISAHDSVTVMVYSELADQKLAVRTMRFGAREYLLLPLEDGVIAEALARVSNSPRSKANGTEKKLGNLFVFLGAKGGSGVTTATCNLAVAVARMSEQKTLLIDLTLPMGDAALALGLSGEFSTEDALQHADRIDGSLLQKLLVRHKSGLMVLPAPSKISKAEATQEAIDKLIDVARGEFDHVIVDLGSKIDAVGSGAFKQATTIYLVTQTSISELRNSNRLISQYFTEDAPKLEVVLNRFEPRLLEAVDEDVVTKALGRPVRWKIPDDQEASREMQHGQTGDSDTRISRIAAEIASSITGRPAPQKKKKGFGLKGLSRTLGESLSTGDEIPSVTVVPRKPREPRVLTRRTPTIKWATPSPIYCGEMLGADQLNATASVPGTFEYNPGLGEILPAGTHTLSVVFIPADSDLNAIAQATVSLEVVRVMPSITWPDPDPIPSGTALGAKQLCAVASVPGTFEYSPAAGTELSTGTHTLSATFIPADLAKYASTVATVSIEVIKSAAIIDWSAPQPIECGTALSGSQLCAIASMPGTFEYSPSAGEVLEAGEHTLSVTFTPADSDNHAPTVARVRIQVNKIVPVIEWPAPQPIHEGTRLSRAQLCATASVPGHFDYSHAEGNAPPPGTHSLKAFFTPADSAKYASAEATVQLDVLAKAIPVITWPAPTPISYGVPLGSNQLCATASVPGTFEYSPKAGEKLSAGTHKLSAAFTPADGERYATIDTSVSLEVAKITPSIKWAAPQPIKDDKPLTSVQLCATASVPGRMDYGPAEGQVLSAGTHRLTATFTPADSANYTTAEATVQIVVIAKAVPVIRWPDPEPIKYGTPLSPSQLCAAASVPGTFEYSPSTGDVLSAGQHTLRVVFTPKDSENYATAQATVPLEVAMITPTVEWLKLEPIVYGTTLGSAQLCATASVPGTFEYSPKPGETLAAGSHTLSATFTPTDSVNYLPAKAAVSLEVTKATPTITWPAPDPIQCGTGLNAAQLCATASVAGTFTYSPAPGEVLAAGTHTLSVTFSPEDTANYVSAQSTVSLEVTKAKPAITWPAPPPVTYGTLLGAAQLCATASVPGRLEYSHEPGQKLSAGTHTLSVSFTPADTANYSEATASVPFEVLKATPVVQWKAPESIQCGTPISSTQLCATASVPGNFEYSPAAGAELPAGKHTLSVTFTPDESNYAAQQATVPLEVTKGNAVITWSSPEPISYGTRLSSSQLCATSSAPGKFDYFPTFNEMLAVGTHVLSATFTPADLSSYDEKKATVSLEVVKAIPVIDWPAPQPITCDSLLGTKQLCASPSIPGTLEYSPAAGESLPAGTHTLSVKFTPMDRANYAPTTVTVSLDVQKVVPSLDWPTPRPVSCGTALGASQLNASAWVPGSFVYSPAAGEVLPPGTHTLSVTFTPQDTASYATAQATVLLNVMAKPKPAITWKKPSPIAYGTPLGPAELCATAAVPGSFEYSPAAGEKLSVGMHELTVTFTPVDTAGYDKAQAIVQIYVTKATPTIRWSNPDPIPYGTPLDSSQFCATSSVRGTFSYSPEEGKVLRTGKHLLTVEFTPADSLNYVPTHATVTLEVKKAMPFLEWPTPKPIRTGTRLSSSQLCATASVPGTFSYSPPPGVELPVGAHTLTASFAPADPEQYLDAHSTALLEVRKELHLGQLITAIALGLILIGLIFFVPSFNGGKDTAKEAPPAATASPATEASPSAKAVKPPATPKPAQGKSAKAGKGKQSNAPTPIPEEAKNQIAGKAPPQIQGDSMSQALNWFSMRLNQFLDAVVGFLESATEKIRR